MLAREADELFMITWVPDIYPALNPEVIDVKLTELPIRNLHGEQGTATVYDFANRYPSPKSI